METIKNYLESMFRNLPKTEKVLRAKSELLQMMEDKYTELVENGISENEAVGTVISEFGNLDELADDLGISEELVVHKTANEKSRKVTFDEVQSFLNWRKQVPIYRGLGIDLCICCVVFPILFEFLPFGDILGPVFMFISIAVGVCLIVFAGKGGQDWHFLL